MLQQFAETIAPVLRLPYIKRTRRNHGLEHATVHILSHRYKNTPMMGRSSDGGFVLFTQASAEDVDSAVREALRRMKGGEHGLAVHPGCGTSRLTTGMLTSLVAIAGVSGVSRRTAFNRLPYVMLSMMLAILMSEPLGLNLQRFITTDGDPGDMEILDISSRPSRMPLTMQPITLYTIQTHST
ncbi:MAG: DUF6391 domain-containing protein [Anaerolineae bacterium]|nr:DUF6391 domain-containing protein [Anaerolineae bacterium]